MKQDTNNNNITAKQAIPSKSTQSTDSENTKNGTITSKNEKTVSNNTGNATNKPTF